MAERLKLIQQYLNSSHVSGWLLYDFKRSNSIAQEFVQPAGMLTRRWFYLVPAAGKPIALVHQIEKSNFSNVPGYVETYTGREEMVKKLEQIISKHKNVLMEYSPQGNNPYVSQVDAGTIELLKSLGAKIQSSQDLVQFLLARWSKEGYQLHKEAAQSLLKIKDKVFEYMAGQIKKGVNLTEFDLQQYILKEYERAGLVADSGPIVAVNRNSANPHYLPTAQKNLSIKRGDLVLIDLWAKKNEPQAVYADITWIGYLGETVPEKYAMIFEVVTQARDAAVDYLKKSWPAKAVAGWQVDNVARDVIRRAGYADFFQHRTGHSLTATPHGIGVNLDNFESKDERKIIPGLGFTIEPGIYLKDFGVRSEINVYAGEKGIEVTTLPLQTEILPLLKPK
jgi:Xaa-Pro aminopeptidase